MKDLLFFIGVTLVYLIYFLLARGYESAKARKASKATPGSATRLTYREDIPVQKAGLCNPSPPEDEQQASPPTEPGQIGTGPVLSMKQYQERARQEAERFTRSKRF